jgi:hypothetical protein
VGTTPTLPRSLACLRHFLSCAKSWKTGTRECRECVECVGAEAGVAVEVAVEAAAAARPGAVAEMEVVMCRVVAVGIALSVLPRIIASGVR